MASSESLVVRGRHYSGTGIDRPRDWYHGCVASYLEEAHQRHQVHDTFIGRFGFTSDVNCTHWRFRGGHLSSSLDNSAGKDLFSSVGNFCPTRCRSIWAKSFILWTDDCITEVGERPGLWRRICSVRIRVARACNTSHFPKSICDRSGQDFSMRLSSVLLWTVGITALWFMLFRGRRRDRQRTNRQALRLSTMTSLHPELVIAIVGTVHYLGLGSIAGLTISRLADVSLVDLFASHLSADSILVTGISVVGAMSWVSIGVGLLMAIRPRTDVRSSIRQVRWMAAIEAVPLKIRFLIPVLGACIEEIYFRGIAYAAITGAGGGAWLAFAITTGLFSIGQAIFCDDKVAAMVIGFTAVVISVFGSLLVGTYGNVVPALVVHMSFVAYYSGAALYSDGARRAG